MCVKTPDQGVKKYLISGCFYTSVFTAGTGEALRRYGRAVRL